MHKILILCVAVILAGCEATAVQDTSKIKTKIKLNEGIQLPVAIPVAYYVEKSIPEDKVNFYGKMEEAAELVTGDVFSSTTAYTAMADFEYLFIISTVSDWDMAWGGWESDIEVKVKDRSGNLIYQQAIDKKSSGAGGLYDFNAVHNSFAAALKEVTYQFLNGKKEIAIAANTAGFPATPVDKQASVKELLDGIEASSSGSGFFINNKGQSITSAHVIDECILVEINHKGQTYPSKVTHQSQLLDLAVLSIELDNKLAVNIDAEPSVTLGKQVFVTGYPLSGILSEYPSLTVGNISSKGGLKGAQGMFQFTAPIQPGNSGGAISDYDGNLIGVVSSTLNQAMMLKESGTTSQNVNFGVNAELLVKFLDKNKVSYNQGTSDKDFEQASADAVEYSTQILCYK